jgi:hypothetical protein
MASFDPIKEKTGWGQESAMPDDKEFELDDLESFSFDDLSLDDAPQTAEGQDPEGVWVKSAPEDVGSDSEAAPEPVEAPSPEASSDDLPEEDFLSSEELAHLDDSFDFVTVEEPQEGEAPIDDEVAFLNTPEAVAAEKAGNFDDVSLDDFVSFEDGDKSETILAPIMDTPAEPEDDFPEEFLDIDIDIDDEIDDEILEVATAPKAEAPAPTDDVDAEDIDLSEFGDFEEVTPAAAAPEGAAESEPVPEAAAEPEFDQLDELDLPPLDVPPLEASASIDGETEEGFFEEEVFDENPATEALEPDDSTDMDHILALEEDLTAGIRDPEAAPTPSEIAASAPASAPANDLAAAILGKIEQELSSIKQEITALKEEVTNLRTVPAPAPEAAAGENEDEPKVSHGFFDDDEDEAIALTGDELDNILSTAEVSEGEEAGVSLEDDLLDMDAEGNLIEPAAPAPESVELEGEEHVTDEEFLAGTALDLNEPDPFDVHTDEAETDEAGTGVPESIELEEDLPQGLDEETDDLLTAEDGASDLSAQALADDPDLDLDVNVDDLEVTDAGTLDEPEALPPFEPEAVALEPDLLSADLDAGTEDDLDLDVPSDNAEPEISLTDDSELELDLTEEPAAAAAETPLPPAPPAPAVPQAAAAAPLATGLKDELRAVLSYMDKLLASLPDDKIQEFAESEHFEVYKRLFEELGLIE